MSGRKKPYEKKSFESDGSSSDTSANIYHSMQVSAAYKDLTSSQKALYAACKDQLYHEKRKPEGNMHYFTMNQCKWTEEYELYKTNNAAGFYRDMSALIEHGFIRCVSCGSTTRQKSVYAYSDMWQKWGTDGFSIPFSDLTSAMQRARRKETASAAPHG